MSHIGTKTDRHAPYWNDVAPPKLPGAATRVGAGREYRREDYVFPRTQSDASRAYEWDHTPPIRSWGFNVLADLALKIFGKG